jgi:hypothetical protein
MVVVRLIGGLGNQMFQYAAGRALSLLENAKLSLDIAPYEKYQLHNGYELDRVFSIQAKKVSEDELRKFIGWGGFFLNKLLVAIDFKKGLFKSKYFREPSFSYYNDFNSLGSNIYLDGYWQSEKYFQKFEDQIRRDFQFKQIEDPINLQYLKSIESNNSISIHVRRGDYLSSKDNQAKYYALTKNYYKIAVSYLNERVINPHYYIFSDDVKWAIENLDIKCPHTFISNNNAEQSYIDMQLMSCCKHNIIANSSFSWWGAWLNPNHQKIVIAPNLWFRDKTNTIDLIPEGWVRI